MGEIKDFTRQDKRENVLFNIDGDVFEAVGAAPAMAVLDIGAVGAAEGLEKLKIVFAFLDQVLLPASAERFSERLSSAAEPITVDQAASIAVWLMEEVYAPERPTEAQSPSPSGSESTGQSSTDGALPATSTQETSTRLAL